MRDLDIWDRFGKEKTPSYTVRNTVQIIWKFKTNEMARNGHMSPPYCGHEHIPLRFGGNVVMRMGTQQQMRLLLSMVETRVLFTVKNRCDGFTNFGGY